jgi:hypothetical protein
MKRNKKPLLSQREHYPTSLETTPVETRNPPVMGSDSPAN